MPEKVKLLRASAGAGKTHRLTREYIRMLLEGDDESYRHILAVTFTNKATDEMKSRIIEELHGMSRNPSDPGLAEKARRRLVKILNDYTCFNISTIDRFFQTVIRSFAREIGQYASYKVELDTAAIISMAVDRMLDSLGEPGNEDLLEWLKDYSFRTVEEGGGWNVAGQLEEIAGLFFKEEFKLKARRYGKDFGERSAIRKFDAGLASVISTFRKNAAGLGAEALSIMSANGLTPDMFKGKSKGPFMVFPRLASGEIKVPSEKLPDSFGNLHPEGLESIVERTMALFHDEYRNYASAIAIRKNLSLLGIYSDLYRSINDYLRENNVLLLNESADLLGNIIDGSDTPFVYEKIGNRYDHIMLDEAQDTSLLQWKNFMPLFRESISKGFGNLVVGDIKQSIYRWRGSDWRLMSDYIFDDLGRSNIDGSEPMNDNWRSGSAIVEFNNMVFNGVGSACLLGEVYDDCLQSVPAARKGRETGRVKIRFIEDKKWKEEAIRRTVEDIRELMAEGYAPGNITILVRKNDEGAFAANALMKEGISVITEDSLLIGSSDCTSAMVNILRYLSTPEDPVCGLLVEEFVGRIPDKATDGSLYEICQSLLGSGIFPAGEKDIPFVHAFLDCVLDYQGKFGSSVRGFLKWWDESGCKKSICAPSGQDAVRIMTIHKAKGLGLDAVIIPFMEEKFSGHINTVWMETPAPFEEIGLIPVKATKQLEETIFAEQYGNEMLLARIDAVNTAYVALTRAKQDMVVYAPASGARKGGGFNSFAEYMQEILRDRLDGDGEYVEGTVSSVKEDRKGPEMILQSTFDIVPLGSRLKLSFKAEEHFDRGGDPRCRGIELHEILSRVDCMADLEKACAGDAEAFDMLSGRMAAISEYHWFDGTYTSLNETSIADEYGNVFRPDRILVSRDGSRAIVIDYKFGSERDKYRDQVGTYCRLLERMGYQSVEGHIWYVYSGKIVSL